VDLAGVESPARYRETAALFSESASRVVVSAAPAEVGILTGMAQKAGVPVRQIGRVGGKRIQIAVEGTPVVDELVSDAERIWATSIESWFEQRRAIA
jgi:phosphoribosylformylglycinamidine synthase